jgi:hypothetical protein
MVPITIYRFVYVLRREANNAPMHFCYTTIAQRDKCATVYEGHAFFTPFVKVCDLPLHVL